MWDTEDATLRIANDHSKTPAMLAAYVPHELITRILGKAAGDAATSNET